MSARPLVLLTNSMHPEPQARLAAHAEVRLAPTTDAQTLTRAAQDADIVVVRAPPSATAPGST